MSRRILLLLAVLVLPSLARGEEGPPPPPLPHTQTLADYRAQVGERMPQFSASLLQVPPGPDWMAGVNLGRLAAAVQDAVPDTILSDGNRIYAYGPLSVMKLDFGEGYVRFANRDRSFGATSPCQAVSPSVAQSSFLSALSTLGLPSSEMSELAIDLVMEAFYVEGASDEREESSVEGASEEREASIVQGASDEREEFCQVERMATMSRKAANGYPVFDSEARMSVSNLNERARLLVQWRKFQMESGLLMRTRAEAVEEAALFIYESTKNESGLGVPVQLEIRIGYLETDAGFVPVAEVSYIDTEAQNMGMIEMVPLAYNPASTIPQQGAAPGLQMRNRFDSLGDAVLVEFHLPRSAQARLSIINVAGREVANLGAGEFGSGWHQVRWDLRNTEGRRAVSGVYFAVLRVDGESVVKKLLVVR